MSSLEVGLLTHDLSACDILNSFNRRWWCLECGKDIPAKTMYYQHRLDEEERVNLCVACHVAWAQLMYVTETRHYLLLVELGTLRETIFDLLKKPSFDDLHDGLIKALGRLEEARQPTLKEGEDWLTWAESFIHR